MAGCSSGGSARTNDTTPVPEDQGGPPPTATATPRPPTPTPTPNPLAQKPATAAEALAVLTAYFASPGREACPDELETRWAVRCAAGDVDGDGKEDHAYLVPLHSGAALTPNPAVVIVRRAAAKPEAFPRSGAADGSIVGAYTFSVADRSGGGGAEVSYLSNTCGPNGCTSLVEIQSWDGTAWRDIGPGDRGVDNLEAIEISGSGADTTLVLRGGKLKAPGAGPTRSSTFRFTLQDGRYQQASVEPQPPEYLIHAMDDADALVARGLFQPALERYQSAIDDHQLKDWKAESPTPSASPVSGRDQLVGYALLRSAIIRAVIGEDPTLSLDAVIANSREPLFANAADAFRRGFREVGGVRAGCLEVTRYLSSPGVAEYVAQLFDYGYANHRRIPSEVCPF